MSYLKTYFQNLQEKESTQFNLWLPVVFALGILCYFLLSFEPNPLFLSLAFVLSVICFILSRTKSNIALIFLTCIFFFGGFSRISIRTQNLNTHFISKSYNFVDIEGQIEQIALKPNGYRLILSNIKTQKIPPKEIPRKIQLNVKEVETNLNNGDIIKIKAHLNPPSLAWYPNGYNFARQAYYQEIEAIGFSVTNLKIIKRNTAPNPITRTRHKILKRITEVQPNTSGNIITALIIGDQGKISKEVRKNYTVAGIIHVLSVSGFHMTIIAGVIFALLRFIFNLLPNISLRYNSKKICSILALLLTFLYLLISGMNIPAVRSFLMISFVLIAILFDRQALSIRSLSWTGFLILLFYPEELISPSFSLSFFACYTLIASYESLYPKFNHFLSNKNFLFKITLGSFLFFLIINSLIFITLSPIIIYHFNHFNPYCLIGNFFTSALFSLLIMPLLFIACILMPFGADAPFLLFAGFFIEKVNLLCEWIANLPYAQIIVPALSDIGYIFFLLGVLWICCWKTHLRFLGVVFAMLGVFSIFTHKTPDIIVSQDGKSIALKQEKSFIINSNSSNIINYWFERNGLTSTNFKQNINVNKPIYYKGLWLDFTGYSDKKTDIIVNNKGACYANKLCIPTEKLQQEGTHTVYIYKNRIDVKTASDKQNFRPWNKGKFNKKQMIYPINQKQDK